MFDTCSPGGGVTKEALPKEARKNMSKQQRATGHAARSQGDGR
jgi:hypothetical protein